MQIGFKEGYEKKGQVIVCDFGRKRGVHKFRVNGYKEDLEHIIGVVEELGGKFAKSPVLENSYPSSFYTVLLEIQLEPVGVGNNETHSNANEQGIG